MSRYKKLAFNTLLLSASGFMSNGVGFVLLPFYTSYLSEKNLGDADLINSLIILLIPVFTLSMTDAILRFCLAKNSDKSKYFSVAFFTALSGFAVMLCLAPVFCMTPIIKENIFLFYALYLSSSLRMIITQFLRGIEKISFYAISEIITAIFIAGASFVFIFTLEMEMSGYLLAYITAYTASAVFTFFAGGVHKYLKPFSVNKETFAEMIKYAAPLIPNSISWWTTNLLNRIILYSICGSEVNGLFSAAARLPSLITIVSTLLMQAWQISAITEYDSEDKNVFFTKIYSIYSILIFAACSFLLLFNQVISEILLKGEFAKASVYVPFLLISSVFNCLSAFLGSIYLSAKKTMMNLLSTLIGAATATFVCFVLIPIFASSSPFNGGFAAGLANICGFAVIFLIRTFNTKKYVHIKINYLIFSLSIALILIQSTAISLSLANAALINTGAFALTTVINAGTLTVCLKN